MIWQYSRTLELLPYFPPAEAPTRTSALPGGRPAGRKHLRLKGWDYSCGSYFITCNTHENKSLFGAIVNGRMVLNAAGQIAKEEWLKSAELRKEVALDEFVIMPNHVHAIVRLRSDDLPVAHTERCRGDRQVVRLSDRQVVRPRDRQVAR